MDLDLHDQIYMYNFVLSEMRHGNMGRDEQLTTENESIENTNVSKKEYYNRERDYDYYLEAMDDEFSWQVSILRQEEKEEEFCGHEEYDEEEEYDDEDY